MMQLKRGKTTKNALQMDVKEDHQEHASAVEEGRE